MGEVGHAAPSGTVVSEFVERPHGASAAAIVRSSEPILIRPGGTGSVPIVGSPMHRSAFATLIETLARGHPFDFGRERSSSGRLLRCGPSRTRAGRSLPPRRGRRAGRCSLSAPADHTWRALVQSHGHRGRARAAVGNRPSTGPRPKPLPFLYAPH